jgi:hypothetical protein
MATQDAVESAKQAAHKKTSCVVTIVPQPRTLLRLAWNLLQVPTSEAAVALSLPSQSTRMERSAASLRKSRLVNDPYWLEWQRAQLAAKICRPRSTAPLLNSFSRLLDEIVVADALGDVQVGGPAVGGEQEDDLVGEPIFDGAKDRPVASALADVAGVWPRFRWLGSTCRRSARWLSQHSSAQGPMLMYTRCTARSMPTESAPPFKMWWTVSVLTLRS